jgi:ribosomal protein L16/L10AE
MPMMPKRVKFRKSQRGKMKGNATRGNYVAAVAGGELDHRPAD